jgi:hypothetical protein
MATLQTPNPAQQDPTQIPQNTLDDIYTHLQAKIPEFDILTDIIGVPIVDSSHYFATGQYKGLQIDVLGTAKTIYICKADKSSEGTLLDHKGVRISLNNNKVEYQVLVQVNSGEMSTTTADLIPENLLGTIDGAVDWVCDQNSNQLTNS